jgi:hypothetical protein
MIAAELSATSPFETFLPTPWLSDVLGCWVN